MIAIRVFRLIPLSLESAEAQQPYRERDPHGQSQEEEPGLAQLPRSSGATQDEHGHVRKREAGDGRDQPARKVDPGDVHHRGATDLGSEEPRQRDS